MCSLKQSLWEDTVKLFLMIQRVGALEHWWEYTGRVSYYLCTRERVSILLSLQVALSRTGALIRLASQYHDTSWLMTRAFTVISTSYGRNIQRRYWLAHTVAKWKKLWWMPDPERLLRYETSLSLGGVHGATRCVRMNSNVRPWAIIHSACHQLKYSTNVPVWIYTKEPLMTTMQRFRLLLERITYSPRIGWAAMAGRWCLAAPHPSPCHLEGG